MKEQYKKTIEVINYKKNNPTKCWNCKKADASSNCPWANHFEPVPGWDAEPTMLYANVQHGKKVVKRECSSFIIKSCPLFEEEPKRKQIDIDEKLKQWYLSHKENMEEMEL